MTNEEMYPLKGYLSALQEDQIEMTFSQVEEVLGGISLDESAYRYTQWWANGGHSHCRAWMDAGFKTKQVKIPQQKVTFYRVSASEKFEGARQGRHVGRKEAAPVPRAEKQVFERPKEKLPSVVSVSGYAFHFIQSLVPDCADGQVLRDQPQKRYHNRENLPLHIYGSGDFCHFTIQAGAVPGVYLWISQGEILYVGETVNLQQRFNMGYGNISPRNCYVHGQSTNCKMNKVVMEYYEQGHPIGLYFYETTENKKVELELLSRLNTRYNVRDN